MASSSRAGAAGAPTPPNTLTLGDRRPAVEPLLRWTWESKP